MTITGTYGIGLFSRTLGPKCTFCVWAGTGGEKEILSPARDTFTLILDYYNKYSADAFKYFHYLSSLQSSGGHLTPRYVRTTLGGNINSSTPSR
jgi:hypothetical protein